MPDHVNLFLTGAAPARELLIDRLQCLIPGGLRLGDQKTERTTWAADLEFSMGVADAVRRGSAELGLDFAFMRRGAQLHDFGLLALDMDSTLITIESVDELADAIGVKARVAAITEAAMRGEIRNYQESLEQRVALLAGLDANTLERVYRERVRLSPGAERLIKAVKAAGHKVLLVSGGFTFFAERLKMLLGLDFAYANTLEVEHGKLSGRLLGDVIDANAKARALENVCRKLAIPPSQAIVVGDGANDLQMMARGGMSVAYHAKPIVTDAATHSVQFGGLDVILDWFQTDSD